MPFTSLAVAPEAASSFLFPRLLGHQAATWMLLSSEWIGAAEAHEMGLVWKLAEPDDLLAEARRHAEVLAAKPISSLVACKRVMVAPLREEIAAARELRTSASSTSWRSRQQRGPGRLRRGPRARLHQPPAGW
ncbi:MAG: enoyl-CoA hydratase-related protein [Acidimicrobiales bacterium]